LRWIETGIDVMNATGQLLFEPALYHARGEALLALSAANRGEAEACFLRAIEIARRQESKALELMAANSLSRLWRDQGNKEQARRMLAEIYGWFKEGFEGNSLREARELLEELS